MTSCREIFSSGLLLERALHSTTTVCTTQAGLFHKRDAICGVRLWKLEKEEGEREREKGGAAMTHTGEWNKEAGTMCAEEMETFGETPPPPL